MSRLDELKEYALNEKMCTEEELITSIKDSFVISFLISSYAHDGQKRENGEDYFNHPFRCLDKYEKFYGIESNEVKDLMRKNYSDFLFLPKGIEELCLLHDVIEETDFSFQDIEDIFNDVGLSLYYQLYIKDPLELITRDKNDDYEIYIKKCLKNHNSALVKFLDLQDNLNILSLQEFDDYKYKRARKYLKSMYLINKEYDFIKKSIYYRGLVQKIQENH